MDQVQWIVRSARIPIRTPKDPAWSPKQLKPQPTVGLALWLKGGREGERDNRLRALGPARCHTVGYIGGCAQEQAEIEPPAREQLPRTPDLI